jgi:type I restriction enzyme, S subunit
MNERQLLTLEEAGVSVIDCIHKTPPAASDGLPYVAIPQMRDGEIDISTARRISREHYEEWTLKASPQPFDVVLSRRCNPGETASVRPGMEFALGQNLVLLRADNRRVVQRFLRWLVRSRYWWAEVERYINVGAVFDSLRCADIPKFRLPIPSLKDQEAIVSVLDALDDKIELNQRMNRTLESLARAIFRSWFIDFDPVRAKAEGRRPPLMNDATAGLFTSRFGADGLPEGWRIGSPLEVAQLISGGTPKTSESSYWDGQIFWASAKDVSNCSDTFLLETERLITEEGLESSSTKIIPALSTVVVARGATTGRFCMLADDMAMNQTCYALRARDGFDFFLYCWFQSIVEDLVFTAHGSVFDTITTSE